jgi:pyruvate/2-oxoacid:ferredoxin oxidoreductase beta subunit/Pyruvate/2-oxoacid:ferredoxin oxidoreductase gamma subunit
MTAEHKSLLNPDRPPVFCPGCSHERVTKALDQALQKLDLEGNQVAIVSDIGCSGLFDTFFHTHAFHGLHGRALTYATGLKMARPDLTVIVTMGDGGLGIGGAHLLSACRRNLDITLLVLNNFNYGMTGGQCSSTTPPEAQVGSGFLNRLEAPLDPCKVGAAAGAGFAARTSAYRKSLPEELAEAIRHDGFSLVDIWGVCPGRYTRRNPLNPKAIEESLADLPPMDGPVAENQRREYGEHYREEASRQKAPDGPAKIEARFPSMVMGRREVVILGGAGQRIVTAGELLGLAALTAGHHATLKNDYPITVLRGHSVSEVVLSPTPVGYTGIEQPDAILALSDEGVARRRKMLEHLTGRPLLIAPEGLELPDVDAEVLRIDFKALGIKPADRALAALAILCQTERVGLTVDMLRKALGHRFSGDVLQASLAVVEAAAESTQPV